MWSANSAWEIMTSISGAVIALGLVLALLQLWVARRTDKVQALNTLLVMWGNVELRESRYFVLNKFKFKSLDELYSNEQSESRKHVEEVCAMCDRVSYAVISKLISEKDVFKLAGLPMVSLWESLSPFIQARRQQDEYRIGKDSSYKYVSYFEKLVRRYMDKLR